MYLFYHTEKKTPRKNLGVFKYLYLKENARFITPKVKLVSCLHLLFQAESASI